MGIQLLLLLVLALFIAISFFNIQYNETFVNCSYFKKEVDDYKQKSNEIITLSSKIKKNKNAIILRRKYCVGKKKTKCFENNSEEIKTLNSLIEKYNSQIEKHKKFVVNMKKKCSMDVKPYKVPKTKECVFEFDNFGKGYMYKKRWDGKCEFKGNAKKF
jgi:wobble nucleotide-excising tRNase